jgi:hypothetical protein
VALSADLTACFSPDLQQARTQVIEAQARCSDVEELVRLVPLLTYLGDYDRCEQLLKERGLLAHAWGRQALFRIWRQRRDPNPWRALIPEPIWPQWSQAMQQCLAQPPLPLQVELVGGLGDALENLALIHASGLGTPLEAGLTFGVGDGGPSPGALQPLLEPWQLPGDPACSFTAPAMRCGLALQGWQRGPGVLWPSHLDALSPSGPSWVVCWRCKPDQRNPLSSFSRSIPWPVLQRFLEALQPQLAAAGVSLLDITTYTAAECSWLAGHAPSVQPVADRIQCLADTQALLRGACGAITVDTSLVHLAALSAVPVVLLLPLFADERWWELLEPGSAYHRWVTPLRQTAFHDWRAPLQQLMDHLQAWRC